MSEKVCQSCGMPMGEHSNFGTNADGTSNADYCGFCFADGKFTSDETMEEKVEHCIPFCLQKGVFKDKETARAAMLDKFSHLKRWQTN